jgi:signal transduction histidine kinase
MIPRDQAGRSRLHPVLQQARIACFEYHPDWARDRRGLHGELNWCGAGFSIDGFDDDATLGSLLLAVVESDRQTLLHVLGLAQGLDRGLDRPHGTSSGEFRVQPRDGSTIDLVCDAQIELDADGRVGTVSGVLRDITERRRVLGGMAHEMSNLLQPVALLGRDMLDRELVLAEAVPQLEIVLECCRKAGRIVGDVLAVSHRARHRGVVANASQLLDECRRLVGLTLPKGVTIVVQAMERAPAIFVDRAAFNTVLLNLATNGAAAMDGSGELVIALDTTQRLDGRRFVRLRMIDSGCGMDRATLARAFEPFFNARPVGQGTGLGLSVAQALVTEMRGTITLESAPGAGTTVTVLLPVHEAEPRDGVGSAD